MTPIGNLKWSHRPGTALLPPKLNLNHLEKEEAFISGQNVLDWLTDPVAPENVNWVNHRTPPQQLLHSRTCSVRLVLEADAKGFPDPNLQTLVEPYRKKLLDQFKETGFNSEQNNWEGLKATADGREQDGLVELELKKGSRPQGLITPQPLLHEHPPPLSGGTARAGKVLQ